MALYEIYWTINFSTCCLEQIYKLSIFDINNKSTTVYSKNQTKLLTYTFPGGKKLSFHQKWAFVKSLKKEKKYNPRIQLTLNLDGLKIYNSVACNQRV